MKIVAVAIVASLAWSGCSVADSGTPQYFEWGKNFSLRAGESAQVRGEALRVGFEGVTADSRCPKGEQCFWAGDAIARIWTQKGAGRREMHELHTALGAAQAVHVLGHELRLVRLDPYPVSGKMIANAGPFATLMLSRNPTTESDR